MSDFKRKLLQEVVIPVSNQNRVASLVGTVIEANEKTNKCKVRFIDKDGKENTKELDFKVYDINNEYPKEGDSVLIQQYEDQFQLIGIYKDNVSARAEYTLSNDIYSDQAIDISPGYIF